MGFNNIKIRNIWSEKNDLVLSYKQEKRKWLRIKDFPWYFVIAYTEYTKNVDLIKKLIAQKLIEKTEITQNWVKLYCRMEGGKQYSNAAEVINILNINRIKHYEADFHSAKRFLIDQQIDISDEYDILYFDIETDDTERKIRIGETRILSIGAIGSDGQEFYFDDEDEVKLIKGFLNILSNYDVLASWNGDEFDLPYIKGGVKYEGEGDNKKRIEIIGRMDHLGIINPYVWKRIAHVDLLKRFRKIYKEDSAIKSYSLENISQYFLKKGKIKVKGRIVDLPKNKLKEYNLHDVKLLKELDEKLNVISLIGKTCAISKTLLYQFAGTYVGEVIDNTIIKEAHLKGEYVPSNIKRSKETYVGAFVYEPKPGLYNNVVVFDFKSLYPSIISTFNIGFDTILENTALYNKNGLILNPGTGISFIRNKKSIVASAVEKLVEARQSYKKLRLSLVEAGKMKTQEYETAKANENVVKELSNSVYGILGSQYHRYYSKALAESITKTGQFLFHLSKSFFERRGLNVIYGDTDSIFVQWSSLRKIEETMEEYHRGLHKILKEKFNCSEVNIYLKYEKRFDKLIMLGKKYYVGHVTNIEGKVVDEQIVKGIDLVKKGTLNLTSQIQQGVIDLVYANKSIDDIKRFLKGHQVSLLKHKFGFDDLKIVKGVGEALGDYKEVSQNQPHIMAAKKIIEKIGYLETNTVEYVVVNKKAESNDFNKIALEEEYTGEFDRIYYWNEHLFSAAKRILEIVYPKVFWDGEFLLKYPKKNKTMVDINQLTLF